MFRKLKNRKIARRLASIGSRVDESFMVYLNNDEPCSFPTKQDMLSYIAAYRDSNEIFRLQMYRIETFTL